MTNYEKLIQVLSELFQFDQSDLDFGIYRIMNHKRDEIQQFLEKDLLPQVRQVLEGEAQGGTTNVQKELEEAIAAARSLKVDPELTDRVKELRQQLASGTDVGTLENEVFSHLTSFFRRYYHQGDFISKRRYKEGVYAIPYQGEEVKLHWANHDQYYIKSSEHLSLFRFALGSKQHVEFRLVEADPDKDNQKAAKGQERRFMIHTDKPCEKEGDTLRIWFHYAVPAGKVQRQDDYNREALDALREAVPKAFAGVWALQPTEKNPKRTLLEKRLKEYTARNTFDYFIHKHLGRFLQQELDFYIKNEVLHVDDFHTSDPEGVLRQVRMVRALKGIAEKLITFLAQLEDFQKKLWLKKKFVTEAHYGITLDRVPKELYNTIAANAAQVEEWERLFHISELKNGKKPDAKFLEAHPYLVLDTAHFTDPETGHNPVKEDLLKHIEDVDGQCDGVLISGDNFNSLRLLQGPYKNLIDYVFIDPPYNTGEDGFIYKDNYQHSSWLSMLFDRLAITGDLLSNNGLFGSTIDFVEVSRLRLLCDEVFGDENFLADIAWEKRYTRSNNAKRFYSLKDTLLCYRGSTELEIVKEERSEKSKENYSNPDDDPKGPWISSSYVNPATKEARKNLVYPILNPNTKKKVEHPTHAWKYDQKTHKSHLKENRLYWGVKGENEYPRLKTYLSEANPGLVPTDVWNYKDSGTTDEGGNSLKALFGTAVFDTPKPPQLISRFLKLTTQDKQVHTILDYFAGSGTTGHAVINLNREDPEGQRKYILCEMGQYFDTVLLPRIKKVIYSKDWKDGKPVGREGISHCFKYLRLESYEDALNNLRTVRSEDQTLALEENDRFREGYMLGYWLDTETRGSRSLLNTARFDDPFNYFLDITRDNATAPQRIDLVETFNYLLGLHVRTIDHLQGFVVVQGHNRAEENVLVIWRNTTEKDNAALNAFVEKMGFHTKAPHFDRIYVNGDNTLENLKASDAGSAGWKVELIEEAMGRLMFEGGD